MILGNGFKLKEKEENLLADISVMSREGSSAWKVEGAPWSRAFFGGKQFYCYWYNQFWTRLNLGDIRSRASRHVCWHAPSQQHASGFQAKHSDCS